MKTIDIHAHVVPESLWKAIDAKQEWHGFRHEAGEGLGTVVGGGMRKIGRASCRERVFRVV